MDWVIDTCVLLDILDEIPPYAEAAAEALDEKAVEGELTVAPITYVELSPAFNGDRAMQDLFLRNVGVNIDFGGNAAAVFTAHKAWYEHILRKRSGTEKKRPIADVMIGAFAMRKGGLITRNEADFKTLYPKRRNIRIVKFVHIDIFRSTLPVRTFDTPLGHPLCHRQVRRQIEPSAKILEWTTLRQVRTLKEGISSVVEFHYRRPPFRRQTRCRSATASAKETVCSAS